MGHTLPITCQVVVIKQDIEVTQCQKAELGQIYNIFLKSAHLGNRKR